MPTKKYQTTTVLGELDEQTRAELKTLIRTLIRLLPDDALAVIADKARRQRPVSLADLIGDREAARALLNEALVAHRQQQAELLNELIELAKGLNDTDTNNNKGPETPEDKR